MFLKMQKSDMDLEELGLEMAERKKALVEDQKNNAETLLQYVRGYPGIELIASLGRQQ